MANNADWQTYLGWERIAAGGSGAAGYDFEQRLWEIWKKRSDKKSIANLTRAAEEWILREAGNWDEIGGRIQDWLSSKRLRDDNPEYGRFLLRARDDVLTELRTSLQRLLARQTHPVFAEYTSDESRQYTRDFIAQVDDAIRQFHSWVVLPEAETHFPDFASLPPGLRDYIYAAVERAKFQRLPYGTSEDDIVNQLRAEIWYHSTYGLLATHDWASHSTPEELIARRRNEGCVTCEGHPPRAFTAVALSNRSDLLERWQEYCEEVAGLDEDLRWVSSWITQSAAKRAELLYDHTIVMIEPPEDELDSEELHAVLKTLSQEERKCYAKAEVINEGFEVLVDRHLRSHGYGATRTVEGREVLVPPLPVPSSDAPEDHPLAELRSQSRRAWQHESEKRIRQLIADNRSAEFVLESTYNYYLELIRWDHGEGPELDAALHRLGAEWAAIVDPTGEPQPALGGWKMSVAIGNGDISTTFLWAHDDEHGNVTRRIVSKDSYPSDAEWDDDANWRPLGFPRSEQEPRETFMHRLCSALPSNDTHIVRYLGHQVQWTHRLSRLLLEYCPFGTLDQLLLENFLNSNARPPTSLLWTLFEALATATYVMRYGTTPTDPDRENWLEIVHQNILPSNILLDANHRSSWRGLPNFKLTDFSSAVETWEGDLENPYGIRAPGIEGHMPPEQSSESGGDIELHEKANIWYCGHVLREAMNNGGGGTYPQDLTMLVASCLQDNKDARPTASELVEAIKNVVDPTPPKRGLISRIFGRREAATYRFQDFEQDRILLRSAHYKLGMADHGEEQGDLTDDSILHLGTIRVPSATTDSSPESVQHLGTIRVPSATDSSSPIREIEDNEA